MSVIGTVPAHHMYGIELTVLLPLFAGMSVHADRPVVSCRCRRRAGAARAPAAAGQHAVAPACAGRVRTRVSGHRSHRQRNRAARSGAGATGRRRGCVRRCSRCSGPPRPACSPRAVRHSRMSGRSTTASRWRPEPTPRKYLPPGTSARKSCMDVLERRGADGFVALGRNSDLVEVAGQTSFAGRHHAAAVRRARGRGCRSLSARRRSCRRRKPCCGGRS